MKKTKPRIIIFSGYGLNCEEETKAGFEQSGGTADIVHVNDVIAHPSMLKRYQILAVPGGFSYGDDTGSGKAYSNKMKNHLMSELHQFISRDTLVIGICNGFQILTQLGLLPGMLTFNDSARFIDRWVDLKVQGESPWTRNIKNISLPIAHGEGKFFAKKKELDALVKTQVAFTYVKGEICNHQSLEANPNGSLQNIAGVLSENGKILGMMPHPERGMFFSQLPHWPYLKEKFLREGKTFPEHGPGLQIFENGVKYFS